MAKYLIHAIPQRMWYVNEYLIPSMESQGIRRSDIDIVCDTEKKGCLEMFMRSCQKLPKKGYTWHLQDDVIISSRFREETEKRRSGIVCGLSTVYDHDNPPGIVTDPTKMWYSFPCIRIPNDIAHECASWFYNNVVPDQNNLEYQRMIRAKKYDDSFFRAYIENYRTDVRILNLAPNIVDHIDYLIGGMVANKGRAQSPISVFWYEPELTDQLAQAMMEKCLNGSK